MQAQYPEDEKCPEIEQIAAGDCHVFSSKILAALSGLGCSWALIHNKQHGAAIVNPNTDFVVVDSQARSAFQLLPAASWENVLDGPSEKPSKWSRVDDKEVIQD